MVAYYFRMQNVPRNISKARWKEVYRQVRVGRKWANEQTQRSQEALREFGENLPEHIYKDMIETMIYPPIVLGPYMDKVRW